MAATESRPRKIRNLVVLESGLHEAIDSVTVLLGFEVVVARKRLRLPLLPLFSTASTVRSVRNPFGGDMLRFERERTVDPSASTTRAFRPGIANIRSEPEILEAGSARA